MKKKNIFFILSVTIFLVIVFFLFFFFKKENNLQSKPEVLSLEENYFSKDIKFVKIVGKTIKVDVVSNEKSRAQGLSNKKELKEYEGMLFVFDYEDKHSFWMKEMNFPIDIIWIDKYFKVVDIKKNAHPLSFPDSFSPKKEALYVLEILAGFSEKNNLKDGDLVEFLPSEA